NETLVACAHAITRLAQSRTVAMLEPLPARRSEDGKLTVSKEPGALIHAMCVAAGLGASSAYTWLKVPVVPEMERVVSATTLPVLLLGGDPGPRADEVFEGWRRALALPQVRGLVAGRALLYPENDDVAGAVRAAARLVHGWVQGMSRYHLTAPSLEHGTHLVSITPERAGWRYTGLDVTRLEPGGERAVDATGRELLVLPLSGSARVSVDGTTFELGGREDVF